MNRVVFKRKDSAKIRLLDVMSSPLVTIGPDVAVMDVFQVLIRNKIKKLVVAEGATFRAYSA